MSLEIFIIAIFTAVSCSLCGSFLVLRKMSMTSDSITHTILLGIVLGFFITKDLSSPILVLGAALMGVFTVYLSEIITKSKLVAEDSAVGIVFPLLFSIAIILIVNHANSVHLDTDAVLLGELAFAPFDRMIIFGKDVGAKSIYTSGGLLLLNIAFVKIFFKELKVSTFDPMLSAVMGFSPTLIFYLLMLIVSITSVGAFEAVGSVLVVAFMITPPITAYILSDNLKKMLIYSGIFGALSAVLGYIFATIFDVSIAGSMAVLSGIIFTIVFIFSPKRGLIAKKMKRKSIAKL